jgi:hypothetical protein
MAIHVPLPMENVYIRSGICAQTFPIAGQIRPTRPLEQVSSFGVLIYWPKKLSWLRLYAMGDSGGGGTNISFQDTPAGLDRVCHSVGVSRDQVAPAKFLSTYNFLSSTLPPLNRLFLTAEVDTDDEGFRAEVQTVRPSSTEGFILPIRLLLFDGKHLGRYVQQEGELTLILKPCTPLPKYDGVLTIDLGNTTTTAVTQRLYGQSYRTESLETVPLEEIRSSSGEAPPLFSALRIDRIVDFGEKIEGQRRFPSLPTDERSNAVRYVAGERAVTNLSSNDTGVVLGAKQLLSMQPTFAFDTESGEIYDQPQIHQQEPTFTLWTEHERSPEMVQLERIEMSHRIPAELLFSYVYQQFRRVCKGWPDDVVLTYPTTYSPRELLQLQKAAVLGWLRAMGLPQSDQNAGMNAPEDGTLHELGERLRLWLQNPQGYCPLIALTLDEATAAAFYYLYRRVFDNGGLVRFRYLYPNGVHLLLVDVGGGTTDIALARAVSPRQERHNLYLEVINRSGLRRFGGDSITREICRLLKAKLQVVLGRMRQLPNIPPPLPSQLQPAQARQMVENFIGRLRAADARDILVPTVFDPGKSDEETLQRRRCFHSLWRMAEEIKRLLSRENRSAVVRLRDLNPELLRPDTSPLFASIVKNIPPQQIQMRVNLFKQIEEIMIAKAEVDALLREPFAKLVKRCNRLIMHHLDRNPESDIGIDWVILSGNGSLYPLFRETLLEKLCVPFVDQKLFCDEKDLKYAVAKGATLARMVERVPRTLQIRFNSRLCELLPFDVGYYDMREGEHKVLFSALTSYQQLETQIRELDLRSIQTGAANAEPTQPLERVFVLERRFPGDDDWEPYLSYEFKDQLSGRIEISYISSEGFFRVTDKETGAVGRMRVMTAEDSRPVMVGGDI